MATAQLNITFGSATNGSASLPTFSSVIASNGGYINRYSALVVRFITPSSMVSSTSFSLTLNAKYSNGSTFNVRYSFLKYLSSSTLNNYLNQVAGTAVEDSSAVATGTTSITGLSSTNTRKTFTVSCPSLEPNTSYYLVLYSGMPSSTIGSSPTGGLKFSTIESTTQATFVFTANYTLSITKGTGSTVTVTRNGVSLSNGSAIYPGDVLTITASITHAAYKITYLTVNESSFTSGNTFTVDGDVSVAVYAAVNTTSLSIYKGTGVSSVTVTRTSSPYGNASTGSSLSSGSTVYYGDVLRISYTFTNGYELNTATFNGSSFTSNPYSASATMSASINISAKVKQYTLTVNPGTGSTIVVKRTGSSLKGASTGVTLGNGATIYHGDSLQATISNIATGYMLDTFNVGNSSFTDSATVATATVSGALTVSTTTKVYWYTLSISNSTGITATVTRTSSPKKGASLGTLSSGDFIYHSDTLKIDYTLSTGYTLVSSLVNGSSTSVWTVSGDVKVTASARVSYYSLSVNPGTGSTIVVKRTKSPLQGASTGGNLNDGATIYYSDELEISCVASTGYKVDSFMINSATKSSPATHVVTGNVSAATQTSVLKYALSISAGTGSTVIVNRTKSPLQNADTGNLGSGSVIYYGDQLEIVFGVLDSTYKLKVCTINGSSVQVTGSNNTFARTVSSDFNVVAEASLNSYTVSFSSGTGYTITATKKEDGSSISSGSQVIYGDVICFTFTPDIGYDLTNVNINGSIYGGSSETIKKEWTVTSSVSASASVRLESYNLRIINITGMSVVVSRNGSALGNGATIYYNDVLHVNFNVITGYVSKGGTVTSGSNIASSTDSSDLRLVVCGDAFVVPNTPDVQSFTLRLIADEGSILTATRTSSPLKGAELGDLSNLSAIYYNDVIQVSSVARSGYILLTGPSGSYTVHGSLGFASTSRIIAVPIAIQGADGIIQGLHVITICDDDNSHFGKYAASIYTENGWVLCGK